MQRRAAKPLRALEYCFGALPEWVLNRIEGGDPTTLDRWGAGLPQAASLEHLFD
jgi:hypothetical protein